VRIRKLEPEQPAKPPPHTPWANPPFRPRLGNKPRQKQHHDNFSEVFYCAHDGTESARNMAMSRRRFFAKASAVFFRCIVFQSVHPKLPTKILVVVKLSQVQMLDAVLWNHFAGFIDKGAARWMVLTTIMENRRPRDDESGVA
jgi:hypothetical protein